MQYKYKDGNRDYWRLTLNRTNECFNDDYRWDYKLEKATTNGKYRVVWNGYIMGIYDFCPPVEEIMKHISHEMMCLAIDFTKYGDKQ